jgi:4-carboxymuconolactone decarboxylase
MISGNVRRFPARAQPDHAGCVDGAGPRTATPWHINFAQQNGLSREELAEAFTHLAFYAGWPAAVSALGCLEEE